MFYRLLLAVVLPVMCYCTDLYAAARPEAPDSTKMYYIDEVLVKAKPYREVIPAQHLSGEKLERLNAHSVADALRYFAGVQIKDYGGMGGLKTIDVRNMGSHHVGVFYDGLQIGNAQNGVVDLSRFSLDDMEEISLYNGQKSEIFQAAKDFASASAVYMRTKRPSFRDGKVTNLLVRYKAGSIQLINPSLRLEQRLGDHLSMTASGEYVKSDGEYKFRYRRLLPSGEVAYDTTAIRRNSDIESFRIETGLFGTTSNGLWQAKLYYFQSDRGLPGAIVKNVFYNGERQGDKNFMAQGMYRADVSERYRWQASAKFAWDYTHYLSRDTVLFMEDYVTKKMQYDNTYYQQTFYLSTVHQYTLLPRWELSLAVDYEYNKLNGTMRGVGTPFSYPRRNTLLTALATSLDLGKLKMQASLLGSFVFERVQNNVEPPDKQELTPAFFLGYKPWDARDFTLRFFYKKIFRMPTFNDLYYTQLGYSQLKPEFADQFNLGFSWTHAFRRSFMRTVAVSADAYYAFITDKIIAAPTGSSFRWMMTNMGKVESRGVDAKASAAAEVAGVGLHVDLSYSYMRAQDFTKINGMKMSSYGDQIPYTPWHSGSVIGSVDFRTWALNYSFIYVGERYDGAVNNIARNHVEPWYTHDASIQKTFHWRGRSLRLSVEGNNLLNQYYDVVTNYPMPGRNFRFVITLNI